MKLRGKVALITGASRGIGKGIAIEFAKAGATVVINYRSNKEAAEETLKEIQDLGGYGVLVQGDISKYNIAKESIEKVIKLFGKIDILVNNAGISKVGLFMDASEKDIEELVDVNLKGAFYCSHNAIKHMVQRKCGNIINISSVWGQVGASCEAIYCATKGGLDAFTRALGKEVAPCNIRVNGIAPGVINTEMNAFLSAEEKSDLEAEIPMNSFGSGEDVGKLAVFLASEEAKYITSQIIKVDGGWV